MVQDFNHLKIWHLYKEKTLPSFNLDKLVSEKLSLLDLYYKAFPKYTLHNKRHQTNILKLIADLLGEEINKLTSLEIAIIILVTVYHDIGMVFKGEELSNLNLEQSFQDFLYE